MSDESPVLQSLLAMLASGRDGAVLRFAIGGEWLKAGNPAEAAAHLEQAVALDPGYTAAWKALGKALAETGRDAAAIEAYEHGIAVAQAKGDRQAGKEMQVFVRRLRKAAQR